MEAPLVSVIMCCYNSGKFAQQAIESILNQTYTNLEIIIFDDHSTDGTYQLLQGYSSKDARIILTRNDINIGIARTKNKALQKVSGKYIALMDHDDISHKDRIEKQVEFMENEPHYAAVGTQINVIDKHNKIIWKRRYPVSFEEVKRVLPVSSPICNPSALIRTKYFKKVGFSYEEKFSGAEDYDLWFKLARQYKLKNLNQELLSYRLSVTQETSKNARKILRLSQAVQRKWLFNKDYLNPTAVILHLLKYLLLILPSPVIYNLNMKVTYGNDG